MIRFCDNNAAVLDALKHAFEDVEGTEYCARFGESALRNIDVVVSPANSFGVMDGGYDLVLRNYFGIQLQDRVQRMVCSEWYGEQPVGTCMLVRLYESTVVGHPQRIESSHYPKYLAHTPTMRHPLNVRDTLNAYLAMRAILIAVAEGRNILCPGLCTATGGMSPEQAAQQMRAAWDSVKDPLSFPMAWQTNVIPYLQRTIIER